MQKKRNFISTFLFGVIILGPVLFLVILKFGKNKYIDLPHYGNKIPIKQGDTLYHKVPPFSFLNQDSQVFSSKALDGKIYVAQFFFSSCPSICPVMTKNLVKVYNHYKEQKDFAITSFSIDPERDIPSKLKIFKSKYKIQGNSWNFLTGNKDSIYKLMNMDGFLLLKPEWNEDPNAIRHTEMVVLVDKEKYIRGMYDATNEKDMEKLMDEIRLLYVVYANANSK